MVAPRRQGKKSGMYPHFGGGTLLGTLLVTTTTFSDFSPNFWKNKKRLIFKQKTAIFLKYGENFSTGHRDMKISIQALENVKKWYGQ